MRFALLILLTVTLAAAYTWSSAPAAAAPAVEVSVEAVAPLGVGIVAEVNTLRRSRGLAPLRPSRNLAAAAAAHSRAMATFGFFGHASLDGTSFWRRVQRFYPQGPGWTVGENVLFSSGGLDAKRAVALWLGSPGHRANMLSPRWRELGVAAVRSSAAPGVFAGEEVVVVTADFGARS